MPLDPPDDDPPGGPEAFGSDPFAAFGDMAQGISQFLSLLGSGGAPGAPNWEQARQAAAAMAGEGASEPNVDPLVRMQFEQLARVAELQVAATTGLDVSRRGAGITIRPVNRMQWAAATVDDYRPLFETLAGSLGRMMTAQLDELSGDDLEGVAGSLPPGLGIDMSALMGAMSTFIGPVMLVTMAGSTVGQIGTRAFGSYDLPIPRPEGDELLVVATSIDAFGEDWSLPLDDLRLYTCLDEIAHHAVLGVPHVRARLTELLAAHADAFEADPGTIERRFGDLDLDALGDPDAADQLQATLGNPEFMLNAIRSDRQRAILPQLDTLVSCVEGYVQWVVDTIGSTLLGEHARVKEAFRRRRVETSAAARFVEHLFGLELTQAKIDLGCAFVDGAVERGGREALVALWSDPEHLPTPNEMQAPGLWLERIGLVDADQPLPELPELPGLPDDPDISGFWDDLDK